MSTTTMSNANHVIAFARVQHLVALFMALIGAAAMLCPAAVLAQGTNAGPQVAVVLLPPQELPDHLYFQLARWERREEVIALVDPDMFEGIEKDTVSVDLFELDETLVDALYYTIDGTRVPCLVDSEYLRQMTEALDQANFFVVEEVFNPSQKTEGGLIRGWNDLWGFTIDGKGTDMGRPDLRVALIHPSVATDDLWLWTEPDLADDSLVLVPLDQTIASDISGPVTIESGDLRFIFM